MLRDQGKVHFELNTFVCFSLTGNGLSSFWGELIKLITSN